MPTENELRKIYEKKVDFIDHSLTLFDSDIQRLQKELLNFLITGLISELETERGIILLNERNARMLANFDKEMLLFKQQFSDSVFKRLGENMIKTTSYTSDYFRKMTSAKVIANIQDKIKNVTAIVGVKPDGTLVKGGFIDKLAGSETLKAELSNYIRKSIESEVSLKPFIKGFEEMVVGNKDVKGNYERYVRGFAHDAFFAQSQQQDNFFADQLGLDYYVYTGTKIKSSRPFCVGGKDKIADKEFPSKLGEAFSRKDAEVFDKMDWEGKIPDIKFIVQKGGYQCRHYLMWITKDLAEQRGYGK